MSFLGISDESGATYIGESPMFGFRCATEPVLSPIRFLEPDGVVPEQDVTAFVCNLPPRIFKEDSFDAVTRIRRGVVYAQSGGQPGVWYAQDPYRRDLGNARNADGSRYEMKLVTYQHDPLTGTGNTWRSPLRVVLGRDDFVTFWRVLSIEAGIKGVPVLTIRADSYFGDLPELAIDNVPEAARARLVQLLDDLAASMHRLSPVAVVDRCRDCLSFIFGEVAQRPELDLGKAVKAWTATNGEDLCAWSGRIVARLHARGKPNESISKQLRPLNDRDAMFAVHCVATVLQELRWTR